MYAAISHLRHVDGEKHLVIVTRHGISMPRMEDNRGLAALAADALVNTIYTGGAAGAPPPRFVMGHGRSASALIFTTGRRGGRTRLRSLPRT